MPIFDRWRVGLRDIDINPQRARLGDMKQISLHPAAAAGIDQVANIGVTGGDDAIEGSVDLFKRLQRLQLADVRLVGFNDRLVGMEGLRSRCPRPAGQRHGYSINPDNGSL